MSHSSVIAAWIPVSRWAWDAYFKAGNDVLLCRKLGTCAQAAETICRFAVTQPDHLQWKIAVILAGYIQKPPPNLLANLFDFLTGQDAPSSGFDFDQLATTGLMEDFVYTASRWCRQGIHPEVAQGVLQTIVEQWLAGQSWNCAGAAMISLCFHDAPGWPDLLERFTRKAAEQKPSKPQLGNFFRPLGQFFGMYLPPVGTPEARVAERLLARDQSLLKSVDEWLCQQESVCQQVLLTPQEQTDLDHLWQVLAEAEPKEMSG
ncbi:MAG: hypothetical protein K1Y36_00440 [Blastocatellia bacterium]|nr:hypothetical protein [Blastocatellia bacterium]